MDRQRRRDPSKNLVELSVGGVRYAIAIGSVREIVNPLPTVPLASAPVWIVGVADYRNEVVPVVDLRVRFGVLDTAATRRTKWIVVRHANISFALVVDAVTEVFRSGEVKPAPPLAEGADVRNLEGVTTHDGEMVLVLDVPRIAEMIQPALAGPKIKRLTPPPAFPEDK